MRPGTTVEVNGGIAELFAARADIGDIPRADIGGIPRADIAERAGSRATYILSVLDGQGLVQRRDLFFVDSQGRLVRGYQFGTAATHAQSWQRLPDATSEFNKVVAELTGKFLSMPERP
jgi:hypothetical protein